MLNYPRPALTVDAWKACIKGYPVMFGFRWFKPSMDKFAKAPKNYNLIAPVPDMINETQDGGHAVLAVGWNDMVDAGPGREPVGCFQVQNSWGWQWGGEGYYWMPYTWLQKQGNIRPVHDPWTLMAGTSNA